MKICRNFLEYADKDFGAHSMMHLIDTPPSDKIGPFEKAYREFNYLDGTIRVISSAIAANEIKKSDSGMISLFIYSLLLGASIVEKHMRSIEENNNNGKDRAREVQQFSHVDFSRLEFRNYILEKLNKWLTENSI
jgi:hypothetical protein